MNDSTHVALVLFLSTSILLAGCLGQRIDTSAPAKNVLHVDVGAPTDDNAFSPTKLRALVGQPVTIIIQNNGTTTHTLTNHDFHIHSGDVAPGAQTTVTFTPDRAGTFELLCDAPGHSGMRATLEVI